MPVKRFVRIKNMTKIRNCGIVGIRETLFDFRRDANMWTGVISVGSNTR